MKTMKTLTFVLVLFSVALPGSAASRTVTSTASLAQPGAPSMAFSGWLSTPRFDPALGTLKSITWKLTTTGRLVWSFVQPAAVPYTTLSVVTQGQFMASTSTVQNQMDQGPRAPCGQIGNPACDSASTSMGSPIILEGKLDKAADLEAFSGLTPLTLPVSAKIHVSAQNVTGILKGDQTLTWNFSVTYEYTPR